MALTVLTTVSTFLFQLPSSISKPYHMVRMFKPTGAYQELFIAKIRSKILTQNGEIRETKHTKPNKIRAFSIIPDFFFDLNSKILSQPY